MNKKALIYLSDICNYISNDMYELYNELLDKVHLNENERQLIEDAILTTMHKIDQIKASKISDLEDYAEMKQIEMIAGDSDDRLSYEKMMEKADQIYND